MAYSLRLGGGGGSVGGSPSSDGGVGGRDGRPCVMLAPDFGASVGISELGGLDGLGGLGVGLRCRKNHHNHISDTNNTGKHR